MQEPSVSGETVAAALGLIPILGPLLVPTAERLAQRIAEEHRRNLSKTLRAAERVTGLSREEIAQRIEADARLVPLFVRILHAAGTTGHDETLVALGVSLGHAVNHALASDQAMFDEASLVLPALEDLTPTHFRVLRVLRALESERTADQIAQDQYNGMVSSVQELAGLTESVTALCLLNLASAGLALTLTVYDGAAFVITELGQAVLQAAEQLGD